MAEQALLVNPGATDDLDEITKRIKRLKEDEKRLVAALRAAPNAADSLAHELDTIAGERKQLERVLDGKQTPAPTISQVSKPAIYAFSRLVCERLTTMDIEDQRRLMEVLMLEAVVGEGGRIKASVAIPEDSNTLFTTGQTWA